MSAHSRMAAVNVPVELQTSPDNYWAWLQHIALAVTELMRWANQPRLVPQTAATLPQPGVDALPGMLAFITDGQTAGGPVQGGGTRLQLVFFNGTNWIVVQS